MQDVDFAIGQQIKIGTEAGFMGRAQSADLKGVDLETARAAGRRLAMLAADNDAGGSAIAVISLVRFEA